MDYRIPLKVREVIVKVEIMIFYITIDKILSDFHQNAVSVQRISDSASYLSENFMPLIIEQFPWCYTIGKYHNRRGILWAIENN